MAAASPPVPPEVAPSLGVLVTLGSIARHVEEATRPGGHALDLATARTLLEDPALREWMTAADALALLPLPRS